MICGLTPCIPYWAAWLPSVDDRDHSAIVLILGAMIITGFAYAKVGRLDQMVHVLQSTNETFRLSVFADPVR